MREAKCRMSDGSFGSEVVLDWDAEAGEGSVVDDLTSQRVGILRVRRTFTRVVMRC